MQIGDRFGVADELLADRGVLHELDGVAVGIANPELPGKVEAQSTIEIGDAGGVESLFHLFDAGHFEAEVLQSGRSCAEIDSLSSEHGEHALLVEDLQEAAVPALDIDANGLSCVVAQVELDGKSETFRVEVDHGLELCGVQADMGELSDHDLISAHRRPCVHPVVYLRCAMVRTAPTRPVSIGLVGAGPWATFVHAPLLARHPAVEFVGVWARRSDAAVHLATAQGTDAVGSLEELCDRAEALVFCVPPAVQVELAQVAARRGKALLVEKPLGADLEGARALAFEATSAHVPTQMALTWRYASVVRSFLADLAGVRVDSGRAVFCNGALLGGPFATPWREAEGPLLDLGPHVIDLLACALGPVVSLEAQRSDRGAIRLRLQHANGGVSECIVSGTAAPSEEATTFSLETDAGPLALETSTLYEPATFDRMLDEFVECVVEGHSHILDVTHGLRIQELLDEASRQLG